MEDGKKYQKINSIKVIIENQNGEVLLVQEPENDDWMPLHWGLPGGRPRLKESLRDALKRTLQEEIGAEIEPQGLYKVEELLHTDRTVLMFIAVAKVFEQIDVKGRINAHKWVNSWDLEKMQTSEFTAFYTKKLLLEYLTGNREFIDLALIETQNYYDLQNDPEYRKWRDSDRSA